MKKASIVLRVITLIILASFFTNLFGVKTEAATSATLKANKKSISVEQEKTAKIKVTYTGSTSDKITVKASESDIVKWKIGKWKSGKATIKIEGLATGNTVLTIKCGGESVNVKVKVKPNKKWTYTEAFNIGKLLEDYAKYIDSAKDIFSYYIDSSTSMVGVKDLLKAYDILCEIESLVKAKDEVDTVDGETFLGTIQDAFGAYDSVLEYKDGSRTIDKFWNGSLSLDAKLIYAQSVLIRTEYIFLLDKVITEDTGDTNSGTAKKDYSSKLKKMAEKGLIGYKNDLVTLGKWDMKYADGIWVNAGSKKVSIEWEVLDYSEDGKSALLLCKNVIGHDQFNTNNNNLTWENSTIRKWLNNTFYKGAFSEKERKLIVQKTLKNENNSLYGTKGGNDTKDYVFLLSETEFKKYYGESSEDAFKMDIQGEFHSWWLRTPGKGKYDTAVIGLYIGRYGDLELEGETNNQWSGICPAIWITLSE